MAKISMKTWLVINGATDEIVREILGSSISFGGGRGLGTETFYLHDEDGGMQKGVILTLQHGQILLPKSRFETIRLKKTDTQADLIGEQRKT